MFRRACIPLPLFAVILGQSAWSAPAIAQAVEEDTAVQSAIANSADRVFAHPLAISPHHLLSFIAPLGMASEDEGSLAHSPAEGVVLPAGASLSSDNLDLGRLTASDLALLLMRESRAAGFLRLEFRDADGRWRLLEDIEAAAWPADRYALWSVVLPPDALHSAAGLRLTNLSPGDGAWVLGEALLADCGGYRVLQVDSTAPNADIRMIRESGDSHARLPTPLHRRLAGGSSVYLVASPEADGKLFSHWVLDSAAQPAGRRVLYCGGPGDESATAHYRSAGAARPVTLTLLTDPADAAGVWIGLADAPLLHAPDSETTVALLAGESVSVRVPRRVGGLVLRRWHVSGQTETAAEVGAELTRSVETDETWIAEYALLGDMNDDGVLDKHDVDLFILAISDPEAYERLFPEVDRVARADINGDGVVDERDIEPFVQLLIAQ